jgi:NAD(P)-dependent dehydrogenase (short-subunit alcohol dehydrogenase family)
VNHINQPCGGQAPAIWTWRAEPMMAGRTVVITGGAKGVGRAFAEALGKAGANVVITGRDRAALDQAEQELHAIGVAVVSVVADCADRDAMNIVVRKARDVFGGLDVLVNNAGLCGPVGPTWVVNYDAWWAALAVNLGGTMISSRAALDFMASRGAGRIINIVSHADRDPWPYATASSVSTAAVIKLTQNLAAELHSHGISVISYHPGLLDIGVTAEANEAAATGGDHWERRIASWVGRERQSGPFTPIEKAANMLLQLIACDAPDLSGRYVSVDDDLSA